MSENKFDDTRMSIEKFIKVFNKEAIKKDFINKEFEQDVYQIIIRKSVKNFELFLFAFDEIYDQNLNDLDKFSVYMEKYKENEKSKKRFIKLYFASNDIQDRDDTIILAIKMYNFHLDLIEKYTEMFERINNNIIDLNDERLRGDKFSDLVFKNVQFDIFLSHRYYLRFYNTIVYYILTVYYDLVVYVDWIFDFDVDRKQLTTDTVYLLQYRMNQSKKLLFFNIKGSQTTNWMAWEVGYFSCLRFGNIGILDLDGYTTGEKNVEILSSNDTLIYTETDGIHTKDSSIGIKRWSN